MENKDKEQRYIVDYTMTQQYVVTVGSLWDYNRSLDNSRITRALKVKAIHDGKRVEFEQRMPFTTYDVAFFDGYVFKPHAPDRRITELLETITELYQN